MARFSEMLLNRRRQLGMSIQQVANVIKIRPQIIEYFENGEFTQMPPRGYAQGMISSYARYLGLNPREVIDAYFDDLYEFEKSARTQAGRGRYGAHADLVGCRSGSHIAEQRDAGRVQLLLESFLQLAVYYADNNHGAARHQREQRAENGQQQLFLQGQFHKPSLRPDTGSFFPTQKV